MAHGLTRRLGGVAVAQALLAAGAVATDVVLGWALDRHVNGLLQAALIVLRVALVAGALGVPTSLYFLFPRTPPEDRRRLFVQSFLVLALTGAVLGGAVWAGASGLVRLLGQPPDSLPFFRVAGLAVALSLPGLLAEPLLVVLERPWAAAFNAAAGTGAQIGALLLLLHSGASPELLLIAPAVSSLVRIIVPLSMIAHLRRPPGGMGITPWRKLLSSQAAVALPVALTAAIDACSAYADRAVVARLFSPVELALYRYGAQEVPFVALLAGAFTPVLLPQISAFLHEERRTEALMVWHWAATRTAALLFGIFWALLWIAPDFLTLLYSPRYREAELYFRIYLLLLPVRVVAFMPMLYALKRGGAAAGVAAGEAVLSVALALALTRQIGLAGAAWSVVIATALQAAVYLAVIRSGLQCPWKEVLPWRTLLRDLWISCAFFAPLALFGRIVFLPAPATVVLSLIWGGVYVMLRVIPRLRERQGISGSR